MEKQIERNLEKDLEMQKNANSISYLIILKFAYHAFLTPTLYLECLRKMKQHPVRRVGTCAARVHAHRTSATKAGSFYLKNYLEFSQGYMI